MHPWDTFRTPWSATANGLTLLLLAAWFIYEAIKRLSDPPEVEGLLVFITALVGIAVNSPRPG